MADGKIIRVREEEEMNDIITMLESMGYKLPLTITLDKETSTYIIQSQNESAQITSSEEHRKPREYYFAYEEEFYRMYGWYKATKDFVLAYFKGKYNYDILAMIVASESAKWLCRGHQEYIINDEFCILLGSLDRPIEVKNLLNMNEKYCVSISPPQDFINMMRNHFRLNLQDVCVVIPPMQLNYTDKTLIPLTNELLERLFGLKLSS